MIAYFMTRQPLPISSLSMHSGNSTWHWYVWSIGMADHKVLPVAFMVLIKQLEAKICHFFAISDILTALATR